MLCSYYLSLFLLLVAWASVVITERDIFAADSIMFPVFINTVVLGVGREVHRVMDEDTLPWNAVGSDIDSCSLRKIDYSLHSLGGGVG